MLSIKIPIKPISINVAFQGRRFKTAIAKKYERDLDILLPKKKVAGEYFEIHYRFYLVNFAMTDSQNLLKLLTDSIVRKGIIIDDRRILRETIEKFRIGREDKDRIEVDITGYPVELSLY